MSVVFTSLPINFFIYGTLKALQKFALVLIASSCKLRYYFQVGFFRITILCCDHQEFLKEARFVMIFISKPRCFAQLCVKSLTSTVIIALFEVAMLWFCMLRIFCNIS